MALFPLPVKAEMTDRFRMPTRKLQYSSGVALLAPFGLRRPIEEWDVQVIINSTVDDNILQSFIETVKQSTFFQWQSPRDTLPTDYRIVGNVSGTRRNGGGGEPVFFTRQLKFKRYYG